MKTRSHTIIFKGDRMNRVKYLRWKYKGVISLGVGMMTWASLSAFTIMSKNAIGMNSIPIFEALIFISGVAGLRFAFREGISIRIITIVDIAVDTVFLSSVLWAVISNDIANAGVAIYAVIMFKAFSTVMEDEAIRHYEDFQLSHRLFKVKLKETRKLYDNAKLYSGLIGAGMSALCISYYHVDIITFAKVMLSLSLLQNGYDYYIWNKYLR